jgi:hypothetical protein
VTRRRRRIRRGATIVVLVGLMVWITPGTAEAARTRAPDAVGPCAVIWN